MKLLLSLIVLFSLILFEAEATINICIPPGSLEPTNTNANDFFQDIKNDIAELLSIQESKPNFYIDHVAVDINHPALRLQGDFNNVSIYNLSNFEICFLNNIFLNESFYKFEVFNLTFFNIYVEAIYNLTGDLGDIFDLYGDGAFNIKLINFSIAWTNFRFNVGKEICLPINLEINLQNVTNNFENVLHDEELGALFNGVITNILPESLKIIWSEWKEIFDEPIEKKINDLLHGRKMMSLSNLMKTKDSQRNGKYCYTNNNN